MPTNRALSTQFGGICLVALLSFLPLTPLYAIDAAQEYDIKAAFLVNLGSFVHWPDTAFTSDNSAFNVCTLGKDSFSGALEFLIKTNTHIKKRPIQVQHFNAVQETSSCHVLFIDKSKQLDLNAIFQQLKSKPILQVSDLDNFVIKGGMVQFFRRGSKVRLMLDPEAFSEANLRPSAHLMRVAKMVKQ